MVKVESPNVRNFIVGLESAKLPDALIALARDEAVACGWVRGFAVLDSAEVLVTGDSGRVERILLKGPLTATLDGAVGLGERDASVSLRGVFSKRGALNVETVAGVLLSGTARHGEAHLIALDDATAALIVDASTGFETLRLGNGKSGPAPAPRTTGSSSSGPLPSLSGAGHEGRHNPSQVTAGMSAGGSAAGLPLKRITHLKTENEDPTPEAGDLVDHFAFGRCEVVKVDGDRLHVRLDKDNRIKEIALEMLRVTAVESENGKPVYKLARRS